MTSLHGIGKSPRRKEDRRFVTGAGRYTSDIDLPGQVYLHVVRSPVAHARLDGIDVSDALAQPGVLRVATGADLDASGVKKMLPGWSVVSRDGSPMGDAPRSVLAGSRLRYVGEPVAAVFADSPEAARDAAESVVLQFEELPAAVAMRAALTDGAPQLFDAIAGNLCYDWEIGDAAAVEAAFASAAHVVAIDHVQNRLVPNALEPRAALAAWDRAADHYTLYATHQNPHLERMLTCEETLQIPQHKLRVVSPDVGGGFGSKSYQYSEYILCLWGARHLGRPVKWSAERSESFVSDAHGRDHLSHAEMALDANGKILALRLDTLANLGAYVSSFGAVIPTIFHATMLAGVYTIPAVYANVKGVLTNTSPTDAYRGAGRPEATYTVERLVEQAAKALGLDAVELRRRNLIPADAFPYQTPLGLVYDSGNYEACLDAALAAADHAGFEDRRAVAAAAGKLRGIGVCCYVEVAGAGPSAGAIALGAKTPWYEVSTVRVNPDASVTVLTGAHSHGQSHETTFAQLVHEHLGVPFDRIEILHGDTDQIPFGVGTFASRSMSVAGSAILVGVRKVIAKGKLIAAHMLQAAPEEIEYIDGYFKVTDSDRILAFGDVAREAYLPGNYPLDTLEPGLEETTWYDPPNFSFPSGCHICEVEVDPDTGVTTVERFTVADDFGVVVNPMVVHGQVHGGVAQGIGQAMLEHMLFDPETGQPLTASYLDYTMPRAADLPDFVVEDIVGDTPANALGAKGCGEAGCIGGPAAFMNALLDALEPAGVKDLQMPATPCRVWSALAAAR